MFDKRLAINFQIHNIVADTFNTLVSKYDISEEDRTELHATLAEVDKLVKSKDNLAVSEQPTKPTSKDIIRAMRKSGIAYVPCWVSDSTEHPTPDDVWVFIQFANDEFYLDDAGTRWKYATPFDHTTGKEITEMPE